MRLMLLIALLAGGVLRAEDPWIGTWEVVWGSASYDNPIRLTVAGRQGEMRATFMNEAPRTMRRLDRNTADYTYESSGRQVPTHCTVSGDGKALILTWKSATGPRTAHYDRVDAGPVDPENRMVGVWLYNEPHSLRQNAEPRLYEMAGSGRLSFRGGGTSYTAAFDGKDHAVTGSSARYVALRRIDGRTFEEVFKDAGGKELNVRRVAVSEDGTELKFTHAGAFGQGTGRGHRVVIFRKKQ